MSAASGGVRETDGDDIATVPRDVGQFDIYMK
jgi:hypothetical protein